ncbi:hypothetical protein DFJ58DRAFT_805467 [Suillus subalutaceus]|uniref:uncharacterized protein n=1 Tax=Suillus subalutaceus TaxID=48586 RepID=UPI001B880DCD|nr:uncharacterized protein DFJ58DRAFT_805467 [Suillus subalutaceus]KAG1842865.1 hypothetical protein DFJ58DRAFT_805467 [Suillus subalutaceus]
MKLSLVFSVLASLVILATAYPTQGATGITKRSNVEKRKELDANDSHYGKRGGEKRKELDADDFNYTKYSKEKREELNADDFNYRAY